MTGAERTKPAPGPLRFRPEDPCMTRTLLRAGALLGAAALPMAALAHTGADAGAHHGLVAGLLHPLTGTDHLLAMLSVGAWSALSTPRGERAALLRAPLVFATLLLAGALLGAAGVALPAVEPMIAASLLVLGLLVALRRTLRPAAGALLVGGFALFHGAAHGSELGGAAALAGMVAATALLHAAGIGLGMLLRERTRWLSIAAGGATALFGAGLLIA